MTEAELMSFYMLNSTSACLLVRFQYTTVMITLSTEKREAFGKKVAKLREAGKLPVVIYGMMKGSLPLTISTKDFLKAWKEGGESTVITLETPDGEKDTLIHDVSVHPVTGAPLHADFYVIDATKPVTVKVPLSFEGVSPAVKNLGGVLVKVIHEIEIEVLPKELPHSLIADLGALTELDSKITVKDIALPKSAIVKTNTDEVVVLVTVPKEEEEAPVVADLSQIEVEKKGKEPTEESATEEKTAEAK